MTLINIDLRNVAGETGRHDKVVFHAPVHREGSAGQTIQTAPVIVDLEGGIGSVDLDPGPVVVEIRARGWEDTAPKTVMVPEEGPITLTALFDSAGSFTYAPPVVGRVALDAQRAEDAAVRAEAGAATTEGLVVQAEDLMARGYERSVRATNLLGQSRFLTTEGWVPIGGTARALNYAALVDSSGADTVGLGRAAGSRITAPAGHTLYVYGHMRSLSVAASYRVRVTDGTTNLDVTIPTPPHLSWVRVVGFVTIPESMGGVPLDVQITSTVAATGEAQTVEIYRAIVLDVTAMYGLNPPTPAFITDLILALPSATVDGTVEGFHVDPDVVGRDEFSGMVGQEVPAILDAELPPRFDAVLGDRLPPREDWHPSKPGVILRFDDGYVSNLDLAAPIRKAHGFRGYVAMCTRWQGQRPGGVIMQPEQVQQLATEYGWEIGSHTSEHMDAVGHPDFVRGLDESLADLASWEGVGYPDTFTYPNGSRTRQTDREVYLRFAKCQLTSSPENSPTPHDAPTFFTGWAVASGTATEVTKALQVERMKTYVRESMRRGHVAVLGFHGIELTAPTAVDYNLDLPTFTHIIEWLAAEGIPVVLPRDMPPHNLVADPGFNEFQVWPWGTGAAHPWGVSPYAPADRWQRVTTGQYSGLAAMKITGTTAKNSNFSQGIAVRPGETYRIHALAKAAVTSGTVTIEVAPRDLTGDAVGSTQIISTVTAGSWTDHTGEITIPDGAANMHVIARATDFIGEAWVDHMAMIPTWLYDPLAL